MELKRKYETAMKEKMLAGLERDKMAAKVGTGESLLHNIGTSQSCSGALSHNITGKIATPLIISCSCTIGLLVPGTCIGGQAQAAAARPAAATAAAAW
jgi:hypothetical protein